MQKLASVRSPYFPSTVVTKLLVLYVVLEKTGMHTGLALALLDYKKKKNHTRLLFAPFETSFN